MEKLALNKWKKEYHNLSDKNKQKLKKNVMKSNSDVAKGIEKGNQNLMKRYNMNEKIDNNKFQGFELKKGKATIVSPKNLANYDAKKDKSLSKSEKILLDAYGKITKPSKLNKGDKALYNAQGKRNVINKLTGGLDKQIVGEGAVAPYYDDQKFVKRLKASRYLIHPNKKSGTTKKIYKYYGNKIDVNKDMRDLKKKEIIKGATKIGGNKNFAPVIGKGGRDIVVDEFTDNVSKYKRLAKKEESIAKAIGKSKKIKKAIGASVGLGAGALALHNKLKNKHKGDGKMKENQDNRKQNLEKAIRKNKIKMGVGGATAVGGATLAGVMRKRIGGDMFVPKELLNKRLAGDLATIGGTSVAISGAKNLKKIKNKQKEDDKMKKTAFEMLDEAIEKRATLSPERMDYYDKKMNAAMEGKDSKDNRSSKELKKSYIKSKAKTAVGGAAAVYGGGMAGAMAPGLIKDFKHGIRDKRRIGIAGRAAGAAAVGAPLAVNGVKNLVKDRKEMKSRDNKLRGLWSDYLIEDINEGRKERQKAEKTAFEILDEAIEKSNKF